MIKSKTANKSLPQGLNLPLQYFYLSIAATSSWFP
jgi:hypothetical protein